MTQRFEHVLTHIDNNLASDLDKSKLAELAQVPECHFDFIFSSLFHTNLKDYVALLRNLEVAQLLGFDKTISLAQVAKSAGFSSVKDFEVAFTKSIGQSPQAFQLSPDWGNFFQKQQPLKTLSEGHDELSAEQVNIEIVELAEIPLIAIEHRGLSQYVPQTVQAMRAFRQAHHLSPKDSRTFNFIYQASSNETEEYYIDIAVSVNVEQKASLASVITASQHFINKQLVEGRYATFLHSGTDEELNKKMKYLYGTWLINQNKTQNTELANQPLIVEKIHITEPEKMKTRVYLALK